MAPRQSDYLVCIVRVDGRAVHLRPGGSRELDLVQAVADAAVEKGVGLLRTEAQVRARIVEAMTDVLHGLKSEVVP